jgi:hypothetical protein
VSRDRTRLNIMISEQTGAAARTPAPGRTTRVEQLEDELQDEAEAAPLEQGTRRKSVFDAPHVDDVAREAGTPAPDDDAPGDT